VVEEPGEPVQLDVPRSEIRRGELAELLGNALKRRYAAAQLVQPATHASPPVQQRLPTMQNDALPEGASCSKATDVGIPVGGHRSSKHRLPGLPHVG
jgi:hypothetical protein